MNTDTTESPPHAASPPLDPIPEEPAVETSHFASQDKRTASALDTATRTASVTIAPRTISAPEATAVASSMTIVARTIPDQFQAFAETSPLAGKSKGTNKKTLLKGKGTGSKKDSPSSSGSDSWNSKKFFKTNPEKKNGKKNCPPHHGHQPTTLPPIQAEYAPMVQMPHRSLPVFPETTQGMNIHMPPRPVTHAPPMAQLTMAPIYHQPAHGIPTQAYPQFQNAPSTVVTQQMPFVNPAAVTFHGPMQYPEVQISGTARGSAQSYQPIGLMHNNFGNGPRRYGSGSQKSSPSHTGLEAN